MTPTYALGLVLLLGVVTLWITASFVMKPFFLTFVNTCCFMVYLLALGIKSMLFRFFWLKSSSVEKMGNPARDMSRDGESASVFTDEARPVPYSSNESYPLSSCDRNQSETNQEEDVDFQAEEEEKEGSVWPLKKTASLSFTFCILWFFANYCNNSSLVYTTVASSTVLSSTGSLWTMIIGSIFKIERISLMRILAIGSCLSGVVLVSLINPDETNSPVSADLYWVGDLFALMGAVCYGVYITLLKYRTPNPHELDPFLFFGLVGLFNFLLLWPLFFFFSWTKIEPFEWPPSAKVWGFLLGNGLLGTALSEVLWVGAMWLTSPLTATVGLSLNIPLAMIGDFIFRGLSVSPIFLLGASLVILGFLGVNMCGLYEDWDRSVDERALALLRKVLEKLRIIRPTGYEPFLEDDASVNNGRISPER